MTTPTLGLNEMRAGAHKLAESRREARRDFERYAKEEAEADRQYRVTLARTFAEQRANGEPITGAEIAARATAAEPKLKRDLAHSLARSALLRIEELERDAATLRSITDWSRQIDGGTA